MHISILFHLAIMAAPAFSSTTAVINFDNAPTTPGGPVIPYDKDPSGMIFQSVVAADIKSGIIGIDPVSPRNWGATSFRSQIDESLRKMKFPPTATPANFTVKGTSASSFDLVHMSIGCVAAIPVSAVAVPVPCTMRLTALDAYGGEMATKVASFAPNQDCVGADIPAVCMLPLGKEKMALVEFKGLFNRVVTVLIELVSSSAIDQMTFALGFDEIKVVYH